MIVHKEFINKLAENKVSKIGDLILSLDIVHRTDGSLLDAFHNFEELEQIFYTVDSLFGKGYIDYGELLKDGTTFPITSSIADPTGEELVTFGKMMMLDRYLKKYWGQQVIIKPSIYKYISNGYKTDEEKEKDKSFWQAIIVALVASIATALLTAYFSNSSECLIFK